MGTDRVADHAQHHGRPALFHINRSRIDIQSTGFQKQRGNMPDQLSSGIVEIGFKHRDLIRQA